MTRLLHEIAHLGHAELLTPEPEKSLWFFTQVLGLTENGASGDSVYLRTWDDYEHHSIKLTASATSGIGRTGLRAASEEALQSRVAAIEAQGLGVGWRDGDAGIGPSYHFRDPDGCGPPTSASTGRSSSRPARTSTLSSRRSSCMSTSRAATGSSCATRAPG